MNQTTALGLVFACPSCQQLKTRSTFYRRSENPSKLHFPCKTCFRADVRRRYYANHEANKERKRIQTRNRYWESSAKRKAIIANVRRWLREHKGANSAQSKLRRWVKEGLITRPTCCSRCGIAGGVDGHHRDYVENSHPFDVVWLCRRCHKKEHSDNPAPVNV